MNRRINLINIFSLLIGIIVNIEFFTNWFGMLFSSVLPFILPFLIPGAIGSLFSIWSLRKSSNLIGKFIAVCGFLLNITAIGYFALLFFTLG